MPTSGLNMDPGLVLSENRSFAEVIRPLTTEVTPCFWLIRHQTGGPFDSLFVSRNESLFSKKRFDVPACRNTDCSCWRPNTFPRLAKHVVLDEYASFLALRGDEAQMCEWAAAYAQRFEGECFGPLEQRGDLFLLYGDGWWEMCTPHAEWRHKLRRAFSKCYQRSWRKAGEPPS